MSIIILIGVIIFIIGLIAFFCEKELLAQILCVVGAIILFAGIWIEEKSDDSDLSYNNFSVVEDILIE